MVFWQMRILEMLLVGILYIGRILPSFSKWDMYGSACYEFPDDLDMELANQIAVY